MIEEVNHFNVVPPTQKKNNFRPLGHLIQCYNLNYTVMIEEFHFCRCFSYKMKGMLFIASFTVFFKLILPQTPCRLLETAVKIYNLTCMKFTIW